METYLHFIESKLMNVIVAYFSDFIYFLQLYISPCDFTSHKSNFIFLFKLWPHRSLMV